MDLEFGAKYKAKFALSKCFDPPGRVAASDRVLEIWQIYLFLKN